MSDDPAFTVDVKGTMSPSRVWVVTATIRFRDGFPSEGSPLLGEARLALLKELVREGLRGQRLGASYGRVFLDHGNGEVVEMDAGSVIDRFTTQ